MTDQRRAESPDNRLLNRSSGSSQLPAAVPEWLFDIVTLHLIAHLVVHRAILWHIIPYVKAVVAVHNCPQKRRAIVGRLGIFEPL
jgi:hypothetical protein